MPKTGSRQAGVPHFQSAGGRARRRTAEGAFWISRVIYDCRGIFARKRSGDAQWGPVTVNIEPTNLCNANCVFCGYQFQERPHQQIPVESAWRIIDLAKKAGVSSLGLTPVVGEPLVHRKLEEIVSYAAKTPPPISVGVTTNGILLTKDRYRSLVDAGLSSLTVSMTCPDTKEYTRIYRSPMLNTVVSNLEAILDGFQQGECRISISVRSPNRNALRHPLFIRAKAKGWIVERNIFLDDWSGLVTDQTIKAGLWLRPLRAKILPCTMLTSGPHFFSDGRTTACGCRDLDGRSELGLEVDLRTDLRAVYRMGAVAQLRERFRSGDAPSICVSCRHYGPVYRGERLILKFRQLGADLRAFINWPFQHCG
jgi:hypothetical protein